MTDISGGTIAAISTPQAAGGLAVIRISGSKALVIADKIFAPFSELKPSEMKGHTCAYGKIVCGGRTLDDVVLTVFRAPHSYTGEDTAEISCHGGVYLAKEILKLILSEGAVGAAPGEFTKRAFLNGKLSLTQAEAVMDIISAEGDAALKSARLMRDGELSKQVEKVSRKLVNILGSLAAWTDYPDDDIPETDSESVLKAVREAGAALDKILSDYDKGRIFRSGIDTAIVGRPNVGKSTLMNSLLGYQRSIVTSAAGTTRDVIEESVRLGDVVLKLSDTAGIRSTDDEVEGIGVSIAKKKLRDAELVIAVFDGSQPLSGEDIEILESVKDRRHIVVINKSDLPQNIDYEYNNDNNILYVSAKEGFGLEKLTDKINEIFKLGGYSDSSELYTNERQRSLTAKSRKYLALSEEAVLSGETLDAVTVYIDEAANALLELTGERATEAVVDDVFSRFCVGK